MGRAVCFCLHTKYRKQFHNFNNCVSGFNWPTFSLTYYASITGKWKHIKPLRCHCWEAEFHGYTPERTQLGLFCKGHPGGRRVEKTAIATNICTGAGHSAHRQPPKSEVCDLEPGSTISFPQIRGRHTLASIKPGRNLFIPLLSTPIKSTVPLLKVLKCKASSLLLFSLLVAFESVKLWIPIAWTGHMWISSNPTNPVPKYVFVCAGSTHRSK